jgi:hypothetical protein
MHFPPLPSHEEKPKTRFTGIFIPVEILEIEDISLLEKFLLSLIKSHQEEGVVLSKNEDLAALLQVKENTISKALSHLRTLRLIKYVSFDGRDRVLKCSLSNEE